MNIAVLFFLFSFLSYLLKVYYHIKLFYFIDKRQFPGLFEAYFEVGTIRRIKAMFPFSVLIEKGSKEIEHKIFWASISIWFFFFLFIVAGKWI